MTYDSKFTSDIWAGIPSEEKITNNGTKSFQALVKEQFYTSHPKIFIFNKFYLAVTSFNYLNYP